MERYETWLRQMISVAGRFPSHQVVHILRPPEGHHDYEIAVRYSSSLPGEGRSLPGSA